MPQPTTPPQNLTDEEREAKRQEQIKRNQALVALLAEWAQGDAQDQEEHRETWELLQRVLDEDRLSSRPRFPPSTP
jgi:hypothetical protein